MDFTTFRDCGELLADTRLASTFFGKGLGSLNLREFAILIFTRNTFGIFRVRQPVNVRKHIGCPIASLLHRLSLVWVVSINAKRA
jgi:hypothetical protein